MQNTPRARGVYYCIDLFDIKDNVLIGITKNVKEVVIPEGVVEIGFSAFLYRNLEKVTIPNSVKKIGNCAFEGCESLKSIDIPESVSKIGAAAFANCESLEEIIIPEDITITLTAIGDIMCHNSNYNDAYDSAVGGYDFSYVFEDVKEYIESADIAIGNLETTFAGKDRGYASYPTFNTPENLARDLKEFGIDYR